MNNMQNIVKNDTRVAMHIAVELCEEGDFDTVNEALLWLLQERDDATLGGGECELTYGETDDGVDSWFTQCGGRFNATFENGRMVHPKFCQLCGGKAVER